MKLVVSPLLLLAACAEPPAADLAAIRLPEGFAIERVARVPNARSLALAPDGTLFVGTRRGGKVFVVRDGAVDVFASGLDTPNGVALLDGDLYVAEIARVLRFDDAVARVDDPPEPVVVSEAFPDDAHHGWKFIRFGPDRKLYVPVGAPCNVCDAGLPYAALHRMEPDGSGLEPFAAGIRNTVGFDWDPATGELWFTDNGRDWLGDDSPADELNHAPRAGMHFGFPFCHGGTLRDPDFDARPCAEFTPPAALLGPHVAALGMRFYAADAFPAKYRGGIFVAEHGSWNRSEPLGYRVTFVPVVDGKAGEPETFADGWLGTDGEPWGRPVDVEVDRDGALLVSDDHGGAIWRIRYTAAAKPVEDG